MPQKITVIVLVLVSLSIATPSQSKKIDPKPILPILKKGAELFRNVKKSVGFGHDVIGKLGPVSSAYSHNRVSMKELPDEIRLTTTSLSGLEVKFGKAPLYGRGISFRNKHNTLIHQYAWCDGGYKICDSITGQQHVPPFTISVETLRNRHGMEATMQITDWSNASGIRRRIPLKKALKQAALWAYLVVELRDPEDAE